MLEEANNTNGVEVKEPKFKKNLQGKREGNIASLWVVGSGVEETLNLEDIPKDSLYELAFQGWKDYVSNRAPKGCDAKTKGQLLEEITLSIREGETLAQERMSTEERAVNSLLKSDKAKGLSEEEIAILKKIAR